MSRAERKAHAKARNEEAAAKAAAGGSSSDEDGSDEEQAPLKVTVAKKGQAGMNVANPNDPGQASAGLSRREREAVEAAAAKERYLKLQEAGKTDQARADMARLQVIRQERDEKVKMRKAELEKKLAAEAKAKERGGRR